VMNSRRLMGAYPKAKDHGPSIAGLGIASGPCIATKSGLLTSERGRYC
jgi:hypothetical protein